MKKLKIIALGLIAFAIASVIAWQYIYEQDTPRMLGNRAFPLTEKWRQCVSEQIQEISTDGHKIILVKTKKSLSAYDLVSKDLIWVIPVKEQAGYFPLIPIGGKVFVSDEEILWAFDLKTGSVLWKSSLDGTDVLIPDASEKFVLLNSISDRVFVFDAVSGQKLWETQGARGYTQSYIYNDTIYIVDYGIKAFDATSGNLLWELNNNSTPTGLSVFGDGVLYYLEFPDDETFDLVAYNTIIKKELWRQNFVDNSPNRLYVYDEILFLPENNALYQINTKTGEINWVKEFSDPTNLSVIDGNVYVFEQFNRIIHALDLESGTDIGSLQISTPRVLSTETQEMISTESRLIFSRGCEVFVFGD